MADELDRLYQARNEFWDGFKDLVCRTLEKVPQEQREHLRMMLQDSTSCYHPGIASELENRGIGL